MNFRKLNTALLCIAALLLPTSGIAATAEVTHISGTLTVVKADGSTRVLAPKSQVNVGDVVSTEQNSYARLKFTDGGELTLRPASSVKIDNYTYDEAKPEQDGFVFSLIKGGLRTITGLVGKRGNRDAYRLNTPTATIGIRGTNYGAVVCEGNCGNLANGLYLEVLSGLINARNDAGDQDIGAGQWSYVASRLIKPELVPKDPGLPAFTPTPKGFDSSFNSSSDEGAGCFLK
jgi:hypothetical protein